MRRRRRSRGMKMNPDLKERKKIQWNRKRANSRGAGCVIRGGPTTTRQRRNIRAGFLYVHLFRSGFNIHADCWCSCGLFCLLLSFYSVFFLLLFYFAESNQWRRDEAGWLRPELAEIWIEECIKNQKLEKSLSENKKKYKRAYIWKTTTRQTKIRKDL